MRTKLDIYVVITITGSIPLLVDFIKPRGYHRTVVSFFSSSMVY